MDSEKRFAAVVGNKRGTGSGPQRPGPRAPVFAPRGRASRRQPKALAFPERNGPAILLIAGVLAWLGAVGATITGHEAVAVTALTTGAGMIGASAYYSRVRKLPGVELAKVVLEAGGTYEAPAGASPTEAVQDFALKLADTVPAAKLQDYRTPEHPGSPYFVHVETHVPRGMAARAGQEALLGFADYLRSQGWEIQREVADGNRQVDLVASRETDELWVEVKPVVYALNRALIREIAERFPVATAKGRTVRRALLLPAPPLYVSPEAIADFRETRLELWYADARAPQRFVRAA